MAVHSRLFPIHNFCTRGYRAVVTKQIEYDADDGHVRGIYEITGNTLKMAITTKTGIPTPKAFKPVKGVFLQTYRKEKP